MRDTRFMWDEPTIWRTGKDIRQPARVHPLNSLTLELIREIPALPAFHRTLLVPARKPVMRVHSTGVRSPLLNSLLRQAKSDRRRYFRMTTASTSKSMGSMASLGTGTRVCAGSASPNIFWTCVVNTPSLDMS